ncbi:MAG TPA: hypothetical protein VGM01_00090 [Ktedonobacteraceae bacterium]|jgi:hypothetical protein
MLGITSRRTIDGDANLLPTLPDDSFANLIYGVGRAHLDVPASGGMRVLNE